MKPYAEKLEEDIMQVRAGGEEKETECFLVDNQETGMMEYYDAEDNLIFSRRLLPEERQLNLNTELRAVGGNK